MGEVTRAPALGERDAQRGYRWQYDHSAALVYDALVDKDFEELRLTDPTAGRVDDLVLVRGGRTEAYQFRSGGRGYLTFSDVVRQGAGGKPSLVRSLADGWRDLRGGDRDTHVFLVTEQLASINDHLGGSNDDRPSPDHFKAFIDHVLTPLRSRSIELEDISGGWRPALQRLREASGLEPDEFGDFLLALHLETGPGSGLPAKPSRRRSDIIALSSALQRSVSEASETVKLDTRQLLELVEWVGRTTLQSPHEFPVDFETYAPLTGAIDELNSALGNHDGGYVALTGPPGSGKSTLLSQTLTGTTDRVVRYYACVPGAGPTRTRHVARAFLHDLVLMLNRQGLDTYERQLTSGDVDEIRKQLFEQLEAAHEEFRQTGRRTIVIVDGLDHVDREYKGDDALLAELPRPDELPDGVLFIVGSRTLDPLRPEAQQQVRERRTEVDLSQHLLPPASVIEICRRAPFTADLEPDLHELLAELSGGHPLALSYLLNRLRDTEGQPAADVLAAAPAYSGDIAQEYRAVWAEVENDGAIVEILAVCSRLRIGFTTDWILGWSSDETIRSFRRKLMYLFRPHHDGLRFFHDSFRQFAADQTALGDDGPGDADEDARAHRRVAELCADVADRKWAAEELYHRYHAHDHEAVLALAQQEALRAQSHWFRSPELIRDDIALALDVAAGRADVMAIIRLLLALTEVNERTSALQDVHMPLLLYQAGLVEEAIAYSGAQTSGVPLAQVYDLAWRLGEINEPSGRWLFDLVAHHGFEDPDHVDDLVRQRNAEPAWARAAFRFRPMSAILASIRSLVEPGPDEEREPDLLRDDPAARYSRVAGVLIEEATRSSDEVGLREVDKELKDLARLLEEDERTREGRLETVLDLRVRTSAALLSRMSELEAAEAHLRELASSMRGQRLFATTLLDLAELFREYEMVDQVAAALERLPYGDELTPSHLSDMRADNVLDDSFRYWRLRFLVAADPGEVPESASHAENRTHGIGARPDAPARRETEAIELAAGIDGAVRELARLDAACTAGEAVSPTDAWDAIVPLLDVFPAPNQRYDPTVSLIGNQKRALLELVVAVAARCDGELSQLLSDALGRRFDDEPRQWPLRLRMDLAERLRAVSASTPWYEATLRECEADAPSEDLYSRLGTLEDLVGRYARADQQDEARRLVMAIMPMAFGIGYRKDYQLNAWVSWLGSALSEPEGEHFVSEAAWLARLIATVEPMTEGAPAEAAATLAARVVPADATAAVRTFEYFVRHGTVRHFTALPDVVSSLLGQLGTEDLAAVQLAADLIGELIAPAANDAFPHLAAALVAAANRIAGAEKAAEVAASVAGRTDSYAAQTTRSGWRRGLGLPYRPEEPRYAGSGSAADDYGALVLTDGRRIAADEVGSVIASVEDILTMRVAEHEDSHFDWDDVISERSLRSAEVLNLSPAFEDDPRRHADVLTTLSEAAEQHGDLETAYRLASVAFDGASGDAWGRYGGAAKRRAAALVVRLGGPEDLVAVCEDLCRQIVSNNWVPGLLLSDSQEIAKALAPTLAASSVWPEIRAYLDGIASPLNLGDPDVLTDHGCRWWLMPPTSDRRATGSDFSPAAALAELAVGHLAHPTTLIRDAATTTVIRALVSGNMETAEALARFAQPGASDDILERAGRCLAGARSTNGFVRPAALDPLERTLATHSSQIIRDLAPKRPRVLHRPLHAAYDLNLLSTEARAPHLLGPYEGPYQKLAGHVGLDLDALLAVATSYRQDALAVLPDQQAVVNALGASGAEHLYTFESFAASRAAFGRVVADLRDAGLLDGAPQHILHLLRSVDVDVLCRTPVERPDVVPEPPAAGVDKGLEGWLGGVEARIDEYVGVSTREDRIVVGARGKLEILNWGQLREHLTCGTTVGSAELVDGRILSRGYRMVLKDLVTSSEMVWPGSGEPLVLENEGIWFNDIRADWLAFRPGLAASLGWVADSNAPGRWHTASGELAVETIYWVDGWWGRSGPVFDDTQADGYAVALTASGLAEVTATFGELTRHFELTRRGRDDGIEVPPVSAERHVHQPAVEL